MSTRTKTALVLAIFLAAPFLASYASAGDIKGTVSVQGIRSAKNIAVYVDAIPGKDFSAPTQPALMDQRNLKFTPHVLIVQKGTTVEFLNSDLVRHNVNWPSISGNKKLAHNLGRWRKGQKNSFQFTEVGVAPLLCNVHPVMSGYVVIVPTPYFALTHNEGSFEIKNVPAGKYVLNVWSEEGKPTTVPVTVGVGTATVELVVKK